MCYRDSYGFLTNFGCKRKKKKKSNIKEKEKRKGPKGEGSLLPLNQITVIGNDKFY
jgi:hypothetical protein